ncbi:MAG: SH3 domain-containing protein [Spirochaetaceae bacterium]|nr:SH3 domain-containing protein [Spirochaetaceae bacterium]
MKRLIITALFCLTAAGVFAQKVGDTMYVNVNSANLKSSTGFFASTTGTVRYGDQVRVLGLKSKWVQIRTTGNATGWIPSSSLTTKRIARGTGASASAQEIALAGKGFSPAVEAEYKKSGGTANYAAVDTMERITIPDRDLLAFTEEGHLAQGE